MNSDIHLWAHIPERPGSSLGKLIPRGVRTDGSTLGLAIDLDFVPNTELCTDRSCRWIALKAEIWSLRVPPRPYGRVRIDLWTHMKDGMPKLQTSDDRVTWHWLLQPEDLEAIESDHRQALGAPRTFSLNVDGVVVIGDASYGVTGNGTFECAASDWEQLLKQLQYGLPPKVKGLLGPAAMARGYLSKAEQLLAPAREQLRAGETRRALVTCLEEFEHLVQAPYKDSSWNGLVGNWNWPEQKSSSVAKLFAAHCTYLNRVGHHKDREERDQQGNLISMPVDQWEAELVVAASHMLLTYALRLQDGIQSNSIGQERSSPS